MQAHQIGVWGRAPTGGWGGRAPPLHKLEQFSTALGVNMSCTHISLAPVRNLWK